MQRAVLSQGVGGDIAWCIAPLLPVCYTVELLLRQELGCVFLLCRHRVNPEERGRTVHRKGIQGKGEKQMR